MLCLYAAFDAIAQGSDLLYPAIKTYLCSAQTFIEGYNGLFNSLIRKNITTDLEYEHFELLALFMVS